MSPLANCFAGALAYGITQVKHSLAPWRLLFLIEGAPTIAFAPVVYFFLADSPEKATFLTAEERVQSIERFETRDHTRKNQIHWQQFLAGVTDYRNVVHTMIHFMCNYSFAGLSNFLPTIINSMGYSSINAQGLTAPVYFGGFLCCVAAALISDRYQMRGFVIAVSATIGAVGYLLLATVEDMHMTHIRYLGVWLAVCGVFPALCINVSMKLLFENMADNPDYMVTQQQ